MSAPALEQLSSVSLVGCVPCPVLPSGLRLADTYKHKQGAHRLGGGGPGAPAADMRTDMGTDDTYTDAG